MDEHELTADHMTKQCKNFLELVEISIGNDKQPLFDGADPDILYYSDFGDTNDAYNNVLPYGEDIQDQKMVEVNKAYIEQLYYYIEDKLVIQGKYYIPVLDQVTHRKWDASSNRIGEEHSNPIIHTRIYKLKIPDRRVDEYAVNIIIDDLIEQVDDQRKNNEILENIVAFHPDPVVGITI